MQLGLLYAGPGIGAHSSEIQPFLKVISVVLLKLRHIYSLITQLLASI